jgi:hypothetical protein
MAMLRQDWQRSQELYETNKRRTEGNRTMTPNDFIRNIEQAPIRLMNVYKAYKDAAKATEENVLIYPQGRLQMVAKMREEALEAVADIRANIEASETMAVKALEEQRDKLKPTVDPAVHERKARQLAYLVDRGVPLAELIQTNVSDPVTLRILEEEAPVLARGQAPQYRDSGEDYDELLKEAGRRVYGDRYREADDKIKDLQKGSYRVKVAANAVRLALQNDDREDGFAIPSYQAGQLVS